MDEGERNYLEDKLSKTPREGDDDDDPIEGPLAELSSSDDDDDVSEGDEHVSSLSEGAESDASEFGDPFEGILHSRCQNARGTNHVYTDSYSSDFRGKAP